SPGSHEMTVITTAYVPTQSVFYEDRHPNEIVKYQNSGNIKVSENPNIRSRQGKWQMTSELTDFTRDVYSFIDSFRKEVLKAMKEDKNEYVLHCRSFFQNVTRMNVQELTEMGYESFFSDLGQGQISDPFFKQVLKPALEKVLSDYGCKLTL